ncbi:MAG: molybdate ABC transporter substrate-binding protein [Acinetobacter sp.]|uniref:molybdate ABC transporter substrate-binding protein n=1 Tax=Acinetobacter sp. TaxID=472 RepID=UPI001DCDC43D|nr:molybdate ABC transporter substrate-binding protein [Acinetobacter sp.]
MDLFKVLLTGVLLTSSMLHAETVRIYAAASLTNAITDISKLYEQQHRDIQIVPVFAASSVLAKQIAAGASSDLFFSADLDWMNDLIKKQKIQIGQIRPLLLNELVLISPLQKKNHFKMSANFNFAQAFQGYLCTGQMESVPAGKYAQQSLIRLGWLNPLRGRIVGTDSVRSTLAFVERGECQVGIVYRTDALMSKKVRISGVFPASTHRPIVYPIALTRQGQKNQAAIQFSEFIQTSPRARQIFQKYGFKLKVP